MKDSKLVELLLKLSVREHTRFHKYVHSDFFCKHPQLRSLCEWILSFAPDFIDEAMEKPACYAHVAPDEAFNEDRLNNLMSDLLHLLYDFLAYTQYEQQAIQQKLYLLDSLFEKDADKHIKRTVSRVQQMQRQAPKRNYIYYQNAARLNEQLDRYEVLNEQRRFNPYLQQTSDLLDRYFVLNKLRIATDMASRNAIIKATYECQLLDMLLEEYQRQQSWQEDPVVQLYYTALQMLQQREDPNHYHQLKALMQTNAQLLPEGEARNLYNYALNFTIQKINSGESQYYREALELYKAMLEQEIIFVDGYLTQWSYKNIITTGIRLEEFDWTNQFIFDYQDRLLPGERTNAVAYNLAAFYYAKGQYKEALLQLQDVEFTDSSYHLGAKIIQLKSYYELDETEPFYSLIEAFRKYLRRNRQIGDYRKRANMNLLNLAQRIFRFKQERHTLSGAKKKAVWGDLKNRLEETEPVANKNWLEGVLEVLRSNP